jgi:hypothetical protein
MVKFKKGSRDLTASELFIIGILFYGQFYLIGGFLSSALSVIGFILILFSIAAYFRTRKKNRNTTTED